MKVEIIMVHVYIRNLKKKKNKVMDILLKCDS